MSLIATALASGAAKDAAESAADSVKDAYQRLRALISRRFADNKTAEGALAEHTADPATWHAPLAKALIQTGASTDAVVIDAAQQLMALIARLALKSENTTLTFTVHKACRSVKGVSK